MGNYVKTPTVYQMEVTECGAASFAMIMGYFGRYIPLEQARIEVDVTRDGCNAANIMRAAKRFGLNCRGFRKEPEALRDIETPCIIHWNFNHFVVFEGFKGAYAYLNDPAVGRRKLTAEELDECFTGVVLTFSKTEQFVPEKKNVSAPEFLKARLRDYLGVVIKLIYIGILLVFPGMVLPVLSQVFLDDVLIGGYSDWLTKILVFMGSCVVLKVGLSWYRDLILSKLSGHMNLASGNAFLMHMLRLPISFFDQRNAGDLVSRMDNNSELNSFLADDLAETVLNILIAAFYAVVLLLYSPLLTLIGVVNVAICIGVIYLSNKSMSTVSLRIQMSAGKLYASMCSGYGITDTIKATSVENEYITRVLGNQAKQVNDVQRLNRFQKIVNAIPSATTDVSNVLILMVGGILIINGKLTMGMLVAFTSLFESFCDPVKKLVGFIQNIQTLKADICRVDDVEKYEEDTRYNNKDVSTKYVFNGKVELRNISFGYSKIKPPLVEGLSFKLDPGESIAFVGPSGCGKSTVSKIASGLYHPWGGEVLLDDVPIDNISKTVFNSAVATVSQNISLFSGSIRDNLTMWRTDILEELIDDAAKDACIYDDIMAMGGYDALLTEGAQNLSGGQRQRLEIARALITNPAVLVMDEATSALDAKTEEQVLDRVRRRGCTCIIVAHRLSAIRDCKQIIVMQHGKVVETGNHESLIKKDGYYKKLVSNM